MAQGRVRCLHKGVAGTFDDFEDVRIIISLAGVFPLLQAARDRKVVYAAGLLTLSENIRYGGLPVKVDLRPPEVVRDTYISGCRCTKPLSHFFLCGIIPA